MKIVERWMRQTLCNLTGANTFSISTDVWAYKNKIPPSDFKKWEYKEQAWTRNTEDGFIQSNLKRSYSLLKRQFTSYGKFIVKIKIFYSENGAFQHHIIKTGYTPWKTVYEDLLLIHFPFQKSMSFQLKIPVLSFLLKCIILK